MSEEVFKLFGNCYRVSSLGYVESNHSGEWKVKKVKKSKSDSRGGFYLTISLSKGHKRVHHLMWEVFKGPRKKGYVINHIDGDRENNSIDNLEEVTQKENIKNLIDRGNFKPFGKCYERPSV